MEQVRKFRIPSLTMEFFIINRSLYPATVKDQLQDTQTTEPFLCFPPPSWHQLFMTEPPALYWVVHITREHVSDRIWLDKPFL